MIEIHNLTTVPADEGFLKRVAKKVLEGESEKETDLSIVLVGQGRIKELNKKYRKKNRVTDILAFAENRIPKNITGLGEIVICAREVKKNAKRYQSTFEKELAKVLIHGILHLLGQDHEKSEKEAEAMQRKENHYLTQLRF